LPKRARAGNSGVPATRHHVDPRPVATLDDPLIVIEAHSGTLQSTQPILIRMVDAQLLTEMSQALFGAAPARSGIDPCVSAGFYDEVVEKSIEFPQAVSKHPGRQNEFGSRARRFPQCRWQGREKVARPA